MINTSREFRADTKSLQQLGNGLEVSWPSVWPTVAKTPSWTLGTAIIVNGWRYKYGLNGLNGLNVWR
jgi:hypothetical protein